MSAIELSKSTRDSTRSAWNDGRKAFLIYRHDGIDRNPYPEGSELHVVWNQGFEQEALYGTPGGEGD
ncbi:MAG TPA: hypothetical protein VEJ16_12505 [Alphaproteobacteria bacterium]|nr:hypothetical protein [Alphaproteobacteria bacterium]